MVKCTIAYPGRRWVRHRSCHQSETRASTLYRTRWSLPSTLSPPYWNRELINTEGYHNTNKCTLLRSILWWLFNALLHCLKKVWQCFQVSVILSICNKTVTALQPKVLATPQQFILRSVSGNWSALHVDIVLSTKTLAVRNIFRNNSHDNLFISYPALTSFVCRSCLLMMVVVSTGVGQIQTGLAWRPSARRTAVLPGSSCGWGVASRSRRDTPPSGTGGAVPGWAPGPPLSRSWVGPLAAHWVQTTCRAENHCSHGVV